jgi:hypothetical protein
MFKRYFINYYEKNEELYRAAAYLAHIIILYYYNYIIKIKNMFYQSNPQFHNQPKVTLTLNFTIYHRNILLQQSAKVDFKFIMKLALRASL